MVTGPTNPRKSAVALLLLVNGYLTLREITFWKDDVTLWTPDDPGTRRLDIECKLHG